MLELVRAKRYFALHAPRQTGKTSVLLALRDRLNAEGKYRCVYANFEVVPRALTAYAQETLPHKTAWYASGGGLDSAKLLGAFQAFFREHSEHWLERFAYREAAPQLLLQAFLQRIVNGGGRVEREYGLGRGRTDLLIVWPSPEGGPAARKYVVECEILRGALAATARKGALQTEAYMDRCDAEEGHLVAFDRGGGSWAEKIFHRVEQAERARARVWGM